eukprot:CAMPEP_0204318354 /NCGR_PEP_ID=MMETSP0469-20131031/6493_1 /ASSEMBLY_ACC=CAM_ASM_000384 /TAXON_ID=2969 /ORGANISM="Oxyrrhis marina" /LENGTH=130 /DNA_ID=CAMNT_0051299397 /DNA_START=330 /DNA_END=720 /DNA_ORIENTATION=-
MSQVTDGPPDECALTLKVCKLLSMELLLGVVLCPPADTPVLAQPLLQTPSPLFATVPSPSAALQQTSASLKEVPQNVRTAQLLSLAAETLGTPVRCPPPDSGRPKAQTCPAPAPQIRSNRENTASTSPTN